MAVRKLASKATYLQLGHPRSSESAVYPFQAGKECWSAAIDLVADTGDMQLAARLKEVLSSQAVLLQRTATACNP